MGMVNLKKSSKKKSPVISLGFLIVKLDNTVYRQKGETNVEYKLSIGLASDTSSANKQPGVGLRIDDCLSACAVDYYPMV